MGCSMQMCRKRFNGTCARSKCPALVPCPLATAAAAAETVLSQCLYRRAYVQTNRPVGLAAVRGREYAPCAARHATRPPGSRYIFFLLSTASALFSLAGENRRTIEHHWRLRELAGKDTSRRCMPPTSRRYVSRGRPVVVTRGDISTPGLNN